MSTTTSDINNNSGSSLLRLDSLRSLRSSATATALAAAQRLDSWNPELRQAYERVVKKQQDRQQQNVEEDFCINIAMKGEPSPSSDDADETSVSSGTDYDDESIKIVKLADSSNRNSNEEQDDAAADNDDDEPIILRVDSSYGSNVDEADDDDDNNDSYSYSSRESNSYDQQADEHGLLLRCSVSASCPAASKNTTTSEEVRRMISEVQSVEQVQENTMSHTFAPAPTTTTTPPLAVVATIVKQAEEPSLLLTHDDDGCEQEETEAEAEAPPPPTTIESSTGVKQPEAPLEEEEEEQQQQAPISREPPGILATQEACWVDEASTVYSQDECSQASSFYMGEYEDDEEQYDENMSIDERLPHQQADFSELKAAPSDELDTDAVVVLATVESQQQPDGGRLSHDDASSVVAAKTGYDVDVPDETSGLYLAEDDISVELNSTEHAHDNGEAAGLIAAMLKDSVTKEDIALTVPCHKPPFIKHTEEETTNSSSVAPSQPKKSTVKLAAKDERQSNSSPSAKVRSSTVERRDTSGKKKKKAAVKPDKKDTTKKGRSSRTPKGKAKRAPVVYGQSARKSAIAKRGPVDLDVSWHSHSSETTAYILNEQQEEKLLEEYAASIAAAAIMEAKTKEQKKREALESIAPAAETNATAEPPKKSETRERSVTTVERTAEAPIQEAKSPKKSETLERSMATVASTAKVSIPKEEAPLPSEFVTREQQMNDSSLRRMPLEAVLLRRFDLKFQEAASLVADARIHVGVAGPNKWGPWTNELYEECEKLYKLKFCGGEEQEEEDVVIMNWPKFLAPVDGLRAPTDADFASSSCNSAESAASSCWESSTGWSSVWDGMCFSTVTSVCAQPTS